MRLPQIRPSLSPLGILTIPLIKLLLHSLSLSLIIPRRWLTRQWLGCVARSGCRRSICWLQRSGLHRIETSCRRGIRRQFIVMDSDSRPCLPTDVSGVGEPLVHKAVFALESIDAAAGHLLESQETRSRTETETKKL